MHGQQNMYIYLKKVINVIKIDWTVPVAAQSKAARLLGLWVRIPPGTWMSVCYECCVMSGRGLFDELITRPEES